MRSMRKGTKPMTIIAGRGTLYTWNIVSPRLGATLKLSADGRTVMRASYGRFSQGVLTGELEPFHPGATPTTTMAFVPATGDYSRLVSVGRSRRQPAVRSRDVARRAPTSIRSASIANSVAGSRWPSPTSARTATTSSDGPTSAGQYVEGTLTLPDGRILPVFRLVSDPAARRFLLTNPDAYSLTYDGLVMAVEKRRSHGWQAFGSYTFSKTYGLQASSGTSAAGVAGQHRRPRRTRSSSAAIPTISPTRIGRLPNDRPHMFRVMGSVDVPRTGLVFAANLQHVSGKPWAAATQVVLQRQGERRILLEPRGSRRLSSQTLLDVRLSQADSLGRLGRLDLMLDVLNLLNDDCRGEPGERDPHDRDAGESDVRSAGQLRRPTPRDARREAVPGPLTASSSLSSLLPPFSPPLQGTATLSRFLNWRRVDGDRNRAPGGSSRSSQRVWPAAPSQVLRRARRPPSLKRRSTIAS